MMAQHDLRSDPQYEYLWADGVKVVKPVRLTAPEYINALCDWIESQVCGFSLVAGISAC
jgi:hypothetical protein